MSAGAARSARAAAAARSAPAATLATPARRARSIFSSSPPYPRVSTSARSPRRAAASASRTTIGVLPAPPHVTLPTLTTGIGRRRARSHPARYIPRSCPAAAAA
jgi:hypothetical protein